MLFTSSVADMPVLTALIGFVPILIQAMATYYILVRADILLQD